MRRIKTDYPGVFYRLADRIGGQGKERVYYVTFKRDGKTVETKVGRQYRDDMTPARAARVRVELIEGRRMTGAEHREATRAAQKAEAKRWTIQKLWDEYRNQRTDSKGLRTDANRFDNYLKAAFGAKEPRELIQLDLDRLRIGLLKKLAPQTVAHILGLLKRIVNFGADKGLCPGPGFKIQLPRVSNEKTEDLTPKQLEALLKAIEASDHITAKAMMKLALFSGMRRGEMFNLKWSDIDFDRNFILLRDPKGGIDQRIPLNDEARKLLKAHPRLTFKGKPSPYVFPGRHGGQRTDIHHQVNAIRDDAKLPADFRALHGLRHVYASMLASSGRVDIYTLQKLLTHKHPRMTQRYAHLSDEALTRAANVAGTIVTEAAQASMDRESNVVPMKDRK
ncbi:MAG: site-specific integrase [Desulfobacterales bacterium]|jgi:integrase|nr:site-specific integrase [Desulfobacterales bacterium]